MRSKSALWIGLGAVVLIVVSLLALRETPGKVAKTEPTPVPVVTPAPAPTPSPKVMAEATPEPAPEKRSEAATLFDRINALADRLKRGEATSEDIAALKKELLQGNAAASIRAIIDFLETGVDSKTGEEFTFAEGGGILDGAPTLRTHLLDALGQLAKSTRDPEAAAYSKTILNSKDSADEWALALRNVAWTDPASRPFLSEKMREMLSHEAWRAAPTAGMLEAFDVIVYTKDVSFVPSLTEMAKGEQLDLQRAAAVALDRMAEQSPTEFLNYLNSHPTVLNDRPFVRADYFAKADFSNPAQRTAAEAYLSRTDVSADEKTKFLKGLMTPASFVSDNLLTESPEISVEQDAARHQAITAAVGDWLKTGRYPDLKPQLQFMHQRLTGTPAR